MLDIPSLRQGASPDMLRAQMTAGVVASPFTIGVLAVAIRIARQDFAEYLALRWPSLRELGRAFAMMSALLLVWFLIAHLTGQKSSRFAWTATGSQDRPAGCWRT
jgi:hypothetical protein